jgi:hypothetical protein
MRDFESRPATTHREAWKDEVKRKSISRRWTPRAREAQKELAQLCYEFQLPKLKDFPQYIDSARRARNLDRAEFLESMYVRLQHLSETVREEHRKVAQESGERFRSTREEH